MTARARSTRPVNLCSAMVLLTLIPAALGAQVEFSGQLDLVASPQRDSLGINTNFRRDNPFSPVRMRLFARSWVTETIGVFGELLYDIDASPRLNGAYVVVNKIAGRPWLSARLGLAPSPVGSFGLRSTYFNTNPLVGVPLLWQYHTNLSKSGTSTAADLGVASPEPGRGAPILYDACWNVQWELFGEHGRFEYSLAITPGAMSNPGAREIPGFQVLGRVGVAPLSGLRLGFSAGHGPYLSRPEPDDQGVLPYPDDPRDFDQTVLGLDGEYAAGKLLVHTEWFAASWEAPLIAERLKALAGYVEARFDFATGWYAAGRFGGMYFGDITIDETTGTQGAWDDETRRTEVALGYRLSRAVLMKLDWQRTSTATKGTIHDQVAIQLSTAF